MSTILLLDNGHGAETLGKRSPDGKLREYAWARECVAEIALQCAAKGIEYQIVTPENNDVPLAERVKRVNTIVDEAKAAGKKCMLVSVHLNAAGSDGNWHDASGWSGWVAKKASKDSEAFCRALTDEAVKRGFKGNRSIPSDKCWRADYYILKNTKCPAVLTENLFQDNKSDAAKLMTDECINSIAALHVAAFERVM